MLVSMEVAILALLLVSVGVFTAIPPARAIATKSTLTGAAEASGLAIEIKIDPGKVGLNTYSVFLEQDGQPLEGAREVALQFTPATLDLPPSEAILTEAGGGIYQTEGVYFSLPDQWQVQVAVRRAGEFDSFANFNFPVGSTGGQNLPWNRIAATLVLAAGVIYYLGMAKLDVPARQRLVLGRLPALGLVILAGFVFYLPTGTAETYINPIPPNQSSIAQGQAIYRVGASAAMVPAARRGPVG
jgi:hypothetical protein